MQSQPKKKKEKKKKKKDEQHLHYQKPEVNPGVPEGQVLPVSKFLHKNY